MDTLEYNHNDFNAQQVEQDRALLVRFYTYPLKNDEKSVEEGRPMFDDTEMIEIRVRGTKDNVVVRPVRADDKQRFREAYRNYQDGNKVIQSGTPLAQWPVMSTSQVEEMKYLGFFTVEQLADANDGVVANVAGLQNLKNKAKAFLEFSKGTAPLEKMQADLAAAKNVNESLQHQLAETQAALKKLADRVDAKPAPTVAAPVQAKPR